MPDKDTVAAELIQLHFDIEPGLVLVYRILSANEADREEPIKLVEVNVETVATGSFEAFGFAPSRSVPFRTVIAEVTPSELDELQRQGKWPQEWNLQDAQQFTRKAA